MTQNGNALCLQDLVVTDATDGTPRDLGTMEGVHVLVLMRHRH